MEAKNEEILGKTLSTRNGNVSHNVVAILAVPKHFPFPPPSGKCAKHINELQSSEIAWRWLLNC